MKHIRYIAKLIPEYHSRSAAILFLCCLVGLAGTATPYLIRDLINVASTFAANEVSVDSAVRSAFRIALLFLAIRMTLAVVSAYLQRASYLLWTDTASALRQRVAKKLTELSIEYFESTYVGEVMDRFNAIPVVTLWFFTLSETGFVSIFQLSFAIVVLLIKAPIIGALIVLVVPINIAYLLSEISKLRPIRRHSNKMVGQMSGILSEMVSQIATIRVFGGEQGILSRYQTSLFNWKESRAKEQFVDVRSSLVSNLVQAALTVISFGLVVVGTMHGNFNPGDIFLILMLTQSALSTVQPLSRLLYITAEADSVAERLVKLLKQQSSVVNGDCLVVPPLDEIKFQHIDFSYPNKQSPALTDISFAVRKGEMLAIVGPSGSGKSTIAKLLLRLYDPNGGKILWGNQDLRMFDLGSLRAKISLVSQEVALFNDTITNNIRVANAAASDQEIVAAAKAAYADIFIQKLPQGYDTIVGERGVFLSTGERQRVAIARAFLRDPELLILDEATSALDSESELYVKRGIQGLIKNRTAIVIAHRLSTISNADVIVVLKDATIVEKGDHASLSNGDTLYARLQALQRAH